VVEVVVVQLEVEDTYKILVLQFLEELEAHLQLQDQMKLKQEEELVVVIKGVQADQEVAEVMESQEQLTQVEVEDKVQEQQVVVEVDML
jgi:hypothetical protein